MSDSRPRLNWSDENLSEITEDAETEDSKKDEKDSEEGLCKVEDPTCEACQ